MEHETGIYVPNGVFILGSLLAGFEINNTSHINVSKSDLPNREKTTKGFNSNLPSVKEFNAEFIKLQRKLKAAK